MKAFISALFILCSAGVFSQDQAAIDSLEGALEKNNNAIDKALTHLAICNAINYSDLDLIHEHAEKAFKLIEGSEHKKETATALEFMGRVTIYKGHFDKAIQHFKDATVLQRELGNDMYVADNLNNIGICFDYQSSYDSAITYHVQSLKIAESTKDSFAIARSYNNIGTIAYIRNQFQDAYDNFHKALDIKRATGDIKGVSSALLNIGSAVDKLKNDEDPKLYYLEAAEVAEQAQAYDIIAESYVNLASYYGEKGEHSQVNTYYDSAIEAFQKLGHDIGEADCYINHGLYLYRNNQFNKALAKFDKAEAMLVKMDYPEKMMSVLYAKAKLYGAMGLKAKGYDVMVRYNELKDSVMKLQNEETISKIQEQYENDKLVDQLTIREQESRLDSIQIQQQKVEAEKLEAEKAQGEAENKRQKIVIWGFAIVLLLVSVLAFIIYRSYKSNKEKNVIITIQKQEVEMQKEMVEEKNREILDSINYAKRLQEAILPTKDVLLSQLKEHFVMFKPKDVVSGDFYWLEVYNNKVYYAAADCTGHGVPGAMVSVVCSNALSKALLEENCVTPAKILDRTRELVIQHFGRGDEDIKDGMDISLCCLDWTTKTLEWSGANNPIWIIRNSFDNPNVISTETTAGSEAEKSISSSGHDLYEIKADKQPIGKHEAPTPFTNHSIQLENGDSLYIFSDGYADQFGGEKGKKLKAKNFKNLLISIQNEPMKDQLPKIDAAFEEWKADFEQLDDVCVIGVRI